jgi:hypothetical protein
MWNKAFSFIRSAMMVQILSRIATVRGSSDTAGINAKALSDWMTNKAVPACPADFVFNVDANCCGYKSIAGTTLAAAVALYESDEITAILKVGEKKCWGITPFDYLPSLLVHT